MSDKDTMAEIDFSEIGKYARLFSGLTPEREGLMAQIGADMLPQLGQVTENFYTTLQSMPNVSVFLEGRVDRLKGTHAAWLKRLFKGDFDQGYVKDLYNVGEIHVKVNLPIEFMSGGITLIGNELIAKVFESYASDPKKCEQVIAAINASLGFCLLIMQTSYQSSVGNVLERFLAVTGMSRALYEKLAQAYK